MSGTIKHFRQLVGIAKGWAVKNLLGFTDEIHRDLLQRHGAKVKDGRISASTLGLTGLNAVLDDYERRGWPRRQGFVGTDGQKRPVTPQIRLIVRLWGRLGQAGKLENADRSALLAWCERQLGGVAVKTLDDLEVEQCTKLIEALKKWEGR